MSKQQVAPLCGTPVLLQSNLMPSKCICVRNSIGAVCHLWDRSERDGFVQEWIYDGKLIRSATDPSKCIQLKSGKGQNGDPCQLGHIKPGDYPAQEWVIEDNLIKSVKFPSKCIHLEGLAPRRENGTICHLWDNMKGSFPAQEWTPVRHSLLHLAVKENHSDIVDLLLHSPRINISVVNKKNCTPLVLAVKLKQRRIVTQIYTFASRSTPSIFRPATDFNIDHSQLLGGGAYGCVFKGTINNEEVAIKVPKTDAKEILIPEISNVIRCCSPYIIDVVAACRDKNNPLLAMQLMDCGDLRSYLKAKKNGKQTKLNVTSLEVAWVVANAIADLHHNSLLHRDIKSANVLLSTKHFIKLGDFGSSREHDPTTMTNVGTPYWIAPEVLRGDRYSYPADIYSFGVLLTELDTMSVPYSHLKLNGFAIIDKIKDGFLRPSLSSSCDLWLKELSENVNDGQTFDKAQCRAICGELFDDALWAQHSCKDTGTISSEKLQMILSSLTDVFLTHDWGTDGTNHRNVSVINRLLRDKGITTWFDEEKMEGNIKKKMISGIENARCIVVFVTQRYMDKVGGDNGEDNCQLEFNYASMKKTNAKMISVLMDPTIKNTRDWTGPVGMTLGGTLYIDFSSAIGNPELLEARMEELLEKLNSIIGKPLQQRYTQVATQNTVPLELLSKEQVSTLLTSLEYSNYCEVFLKNEINGSALNGLTSSDEVKELGITISVKAKAFYDKVLDFKEKGVPKHLLKSTEAAKPKQENHVEQHVDYTPKHADGDSSFSNKPCMIVSGKSSAHCMQLQSGNGGTYNGDRCQLYEITPKPLIGQVWVYDGKLIKLYSDPSKCIHLQSGTGSSSNGDVCHLWDVQYGHYPAQEWIVDGNLIKSAKVPSKCIHLQSGDGGLYNGDQCHLWDIQSGHYPAQEWIFRPISSQACRIDMSHFPGYCIHLRSGHLPTGNGDICHVWTTQHGSYPAQEWIYDGKFIKSAKDTNRCIHLQSGTGPTYNGDKIQLWDIQPGHYPAQEWIIRGKLIISEKDHSKCLHIKNGSNGPFDGDTCHLWDIQPGTYSGQEWTFNREGNNLLHQAVDASQDIIVDILLHTPGINASLCNNKYETPLTLAIKQGKRRLASYIHAFSRPSMAAFDAPESTITITDLSNPLGSGFYGIVYRGMVADNKVAIKKAHTRHKDTLLKEISIMITCSSPYIISVLAASRKIDEPMLALEYMDCGDLREYLNTKLEKKATMIDVTDFEVAWVLSNALADLHHNSILHRDLKSQNVLLSTNHYIKLGDLGIAREIELGTMTLIGTPLWTAPEVLRNDRYSYAADIYSFGVILTELNTLKTPYHHIAKSMMGYPLINKIKSGQEKPLLNDSCVGWLRDIAEKCLSFKPDQRPTAIDIVDKLRQVGFQNIESNYLDINSPSEDWHDISKCHIEMVRHPDFCIHLKGGDCPAYNDEVCHIWEKHATPYLPQEWIYDGKLIRSALDPTR
ncbi:hypothetical protein THRCLA_04144, partial [Thraustotheca clavata]